MKPVIFLDSGDTLVDESTEQRNEKGEVIRAAPVPGARELLMELKRRDIRVALVADGLVQSFHNIYMQWGLWDFFETAAISEAVGVDKPDPHMFETAIEQMHLTQQDKRRIFMVGNNVQRDVVGANRQGLHSVLFDWSPRYQMEAHCALEQAEYTIHALEELLPIIESFEAAQGENT